MKDETAYRYFAFISFQHANAREALRLQRSIETYNLPAVLLRGAKNLPRRIRPTYCYLNDMHHTEEMMDTLRESMQQSRYLIVVCSPNAARSSYINSGIDYFISLGRRDKIIPVIVSGTPYSNDEHECFPEALRRNFPKHADPMQDHSILGINLNEAGVKGGRRKSRQRARLMIVARMLELDFDHLWLRERQRRRKRMLLATLASLLIIAGLAATWHFSRSTTIGISINTSQADVAHLPPLHDALLTIDLPNEQKTVGINQLNDTVRLHNIPMRFVDKPVRLHLECADCLPLDTTLTLHKHLTLPLQRDPDIYGHVHIRLIGNTAGLSDIRIDGTPADVRPDGMIDFQIPLANQHTAYPITANRPLDSDSIYMPCGVDDVILILP